MAVINGTLVMFTMDGHPMGAAKSCTLNINVDTPDASNKDSAGWAAVIAGQISWDGTFDGLYDPSGTYNFEYLYDELASRSVTTIVEIANIDGTGGGEVYRGFAVLNQGSLTAEMEAPATYSGSFKGNGRLNKGTVATS
jgi:hypothetical protein